MSDSEDEVETKPCRAKHGGKSDFFIMGAEAFNAVEWKVSVLLFFIAIIILSDVYCDGILNRFDGAMVDGEVTAKGTVLQVVSIVLFYNVVNVLVRNDFI